MAADDPSWTSEPTCSVSIVVATRNRAELLPRALQSIADQTFKNFEAIIVDDGSEPDALAEYERTIRKFDARFIFLTPSSPGASSVGPASARNRGLARASGDFVAFLDDDDYWMLPDHLDVAVKYMNSKNADYFFADLWCEADGHCPMYWEPNRLELVKIGDTVSTAPAVYHIPRNRLAVMMRRHHVHLNVTLIRRAVIKEMGGFFEGSRFAEDVNFMFRAVDKARRILYRPEYAACHHLPRGNSVTLSQTAFQRGLQDLFSIQQARYLCADPLLQDSVRARESWRLREMSQHFLAHGALAEAARLACQAAWTFPNSGSVLFLARQSLRSFTLAVLGGKKAD